MTTVRIANIPKVTIEIRQKVITQHLSGTLLVQHPKNAIIMALNPDMKINIWMYELKYTSWLTFDSSVILI